jgi:neopullulanase
MNYSAWANLPALPVFNTDNPGVREYLFDVARYWVDFGIDGWRLDVPGDIDDDSFWQEFRRVVKGANPDAYICGEIWHEATRWLQGDQFDAVMNYIFTRNPLAFFGGRTIRKDWLHEHVRLDPIDAVELSKRIDEMHDLYPWEINQVQLNLLDSHDMPRALYLMGGDKSALRLCVLFQMTMPGAPCIYYGDEIGLSSPGDPYCREAFPWDNEPGWDWELLSFYRDATRLRHDYPVLRTGAYRSILARGGVFGFHRELGNQEAIVLFNNGTDAVDVQIPADEIYHSAFSSVWPKDLSVFTSEDNRVNVHIPACEAIVLLSK